MDNVTALLAFYDRQRSLITDHIRTTGVHLTYVSSDADCDCCREVGAVPDAADPFADETGHVPESLPARLTVPLCYTTGLTGVGHPELVIVGLPPDVSMFLLNAVAHQVTGHHRDLIPGLPVPDLEWDLMVQEIPNPGMILFDANGYYDRPWQASVPALQVIWPDEDGRFPGEPGHDPGVVAQPLPGTYRA